MRQQEQVAERAYFFRVRFQKKEMGAVQAIPAKLRPIRTIGIA